MSESTPTAPIEEVLSALLGRLHLLNRLAAGRTVAGESPTVYRTIGLLGDQGPMRIGDLAAAVHLSQPGMTKVVHSLESLGAAVRQPDPDDQRASLVSVTDAGRALLAERVSDIVGHLLPDFDGLTPDECRVLAQAVDILTRYTTSHTTTAIGGTDPGAPRTPTKEQR